MLEGVPAPARPSTTASSIGRSARAAALALLCSCRAASARSRRRSPGRARHRQPSAGCRCGRRPARACARGPVGRSPTTLAALSDCLPRLRGVEHGVLDVSMNVHGLAVERRLGRPILATLRAGARSACSSWAATRWAPRPRGLRVLGLRRPPRLRDIDGLVLIDGGLLRGASTRPPARPRDAGRRPRRPRVRRPARPRATRDQRDLRRGGALFASTRSPTSRRCCAVRAAAGLFKRRPR